MSQTSSYRYEELEEGEEKRLRTKEKSHNSDGNQDLSLESKAFPIKEQIMNLRKKALSSILDLKHNLYMKSQDYKELCKKARGRSLQGSNSKFSNTEQQLKKDLFLQQSEKKQQLAQEYEIKTLKSIRAAEENLGNYWKIKINDLIEVLKMKEAESNQGEMEEYEELKQYYEENKKRTLVDFENSIYIEFNDKYRDLFIKSLDQAKKAQREKSKENMADLINKIEAQQYENLKKEKAKFIEENEEFLSRRILENMESRDEELEMFEVKLKNQADVEKNETLEEVKEQVTKAVKSKIQELKGEIRDEAIESFNKEYDSWKAEVHSEAQYISKTQEIESIKQSINSKVVQSMKERASTEMLLNKNKFFDELNKEFYSFYEDFKKYIDEKTIKKFQEMEKKFQDSFFLQIKALSEKALRPIEAKIKMNYHKKLENLQQVLYNELEKRFDAQYKVTFI